jgi:hypothetical protein
MRDRLSRIAAYTAPAIVALQGTALAKGAQPANTEAPQIIFTTPLLGPAGVAVVGSAIATIGAYRLMKSRKRRNPGDEPQEK